MKHYLLSGSETKEEITRILTENCEGVESRDYLKHLAEDELADLKTEYVDNNLELKSLNDELKAAKDLHKLKAKPFIDDNKELLNVMKTRHREIHGKVWRIANHDSGMMEFVNDEGQVIETRRLKPDEKQTRMFPINKAAND